MIDFGLLLSMVLAFGVPTVVGWSWLPDESGGFADTALGPAAAGLAVGRLTTLALDDPNSLGSLSDMLVIRSGVEFWPGVAAAVVVALWSARRAGHRPMGRLATLAPLAILGYASYEAGCVVRDGCFGPVSDIGLVPPGLTTRMFPVGLVAAVVLIAVALALRSPAVRSRRPALIVVGALFAVASTRAVASIWLPRVGDALTRQHISSIVVALVAAATLLVLLGTARRVDRDVGRGEPADRPLLNEPAPCHPLDIPSDEKL